MMLSFTLLMFLAGNRSNSVHSCCEAADCARAAALDWVVGTLLVWLVVADVKHN
jgi:hypothetical protein